MQTFLFQHLPSPGQSDFHCGDYSKPTARSGLRPIFFFVFGASDVFFVGKEVGGSSSVASK